MEQQENNLKISNNAKQTDIYFFGEIGSEISAEGFIDAINSCDKKKDIMVYLFSGGGSVFEAIVMKDYMEKRGNIDCTITGVCASAASYLLAGARKVYITEDSQTMIHNASGGIFGTADEHRKHAELLDSISLIIAKAYAKKTNKDVSEIQCLMNNVTWLNADETVELGIADKKIPSYQVTDRTKIILTNNEKQDWERLMKDKRGTLKEKLSNAAKMVSDAILCIQDNVEEEILKEEDVDEEKVKEKEEEVKEEETKEKKIDVNDLIKKSIDVAKEEILDLIDEKIKKALDSYKNEEKVNFEKMSNDVKNKMVKTCDLLEEVKAAVLSKNLKTEKTNKTNKPAFELV